uniref:Cytochrome b n=1 Tax=Southwellina hispida TaxID=449650 RepID=A0A0C4MVT3_9BILA|nr:cytochrome b [Southwellina hispida]AIO11163.1 cytochrome b [Southwellina hispida]
MLVGMLKGFLLDLPSPVNLNYWFGLGVSLGLVYVVQVFSGLALSLFYTVGSEGSYWEVVYIMQEVWGGWLIRFVHSSGVSLFFICLYLHLYRGLMYGSYVKVKVWLSGLVVLLWVMGVSFLGYVLPWGSMSYWGMTVVTSMLSAVPYVGVSMMEWLWGGTSAGVSSLCRFYSLHYVLGLGVMVVIFYHMMVLHEEGSSNPLGVSTGVDKVVFHELYSFKDLLGLLVVVLGYWVLVMCYPYSLMDSANFEEVNFMKTPSHIKPEWYFLFIYCILRSISSKLGGVVMMLMAVVGLAFLSLGGSRMSGRVVGGVYWKVLLFMFSLSFVFLTLLGGLVVEYPYEGLGWSFTVVYFSVMVGMVIFKSLGWGL